MERINQLKSKIEQAKSWFSDNTTTQVYPPMGTITKNIVRRDLFVATSKIQNGQPFNSSLVVNLDGKEYWVSAKEN